jgi:hypothetical protein
MWNPGFWMADPVPESGPICYGKYPSEIRWPLPISQIGATGRSGGCLYTRSPAVLRFPRM